MMIFMKSTIIFASFFKSGPIIITLTTNQLFKFQCSEKNFQRRFICYQLESTEKCIELFLKSFSCILIQDLGSIYLNAFVEQPIGISVHIVSSVIFCYFNLNWMLALRWNFVQLTSSPLCNRLCVMTCPKTVFDET